MSSDAIFSIRLPESLKGELDELAAATQRSRAYLVKDAIESYVQERRRYVQELKLAKASAKTGIGHSAEQIFGWMESWGTTAEFPSPRTDLRAKRGK